MIDWLISTSRIYVSREYCWKDINFIENLSLFEIDKTLYVTEAENYLINA